MRRVRRMARVEGAAVHEGIQATLGRSHPPEGGNQARGAELLRIPTYHPVAQVSHSDVLPALAEKIPHMEGGVLTMPGVLNPPVVAIPSSALEVRCQAPIPAAMPQVPLGMKICAGCRAQLLLEASREIRPTRQQVVNNTASTTTTTPKTAMESYVFRLAVMQVIPFRLAPLMRAWPNYARWHLVLLALGEAPEQEPQSRQTQEGSLGHRRIRARRLRQLTLR